MPDTTIYGGGGGITFVGSNLDATNSGDAINLDLSGIGISTGDIIIFGNGYRGIDTAGHPTGNTVLGTIQSDSSATHYCDVSYLIAGGTPPTSMQAATYTSFKPHWAFAAVFSGVSSAAITVDPDGNNGTTNTSPTVTAAAGDVALDIFLTYATDITGMGSETTVENGLLGSHNLRGGVSRSGTLSAGSRTGVTVTHATGCNSGSGVVLLTP